MTQIYVAGIAMTVFGRHPDRSLHDLAGEALTRALADAGCTAPQIGVAYYAGITNGLLQGQISIPGQVVFSKIGIEGIPSTTSRTPAPRAARRSTSLCRASRPAPPTWRSPSAQRR